jgi:hypothetical protein
MRGVVGIEETRMPPTTAPVKTADGQAELTHRTRRLSQRHRTVLLLVDGRRSVDEVLRQAAQAGGPAECFHELVALGLIDVDPVAHVELPLEPPPEDSLLPPTRSLLPESSGWTPLDSRAGVPDAPLEEARELLLRAVRNEAPVSGSLTIMKLKRAASREDLEALLDEVEQRIRKPRKQIIAAQTMRHVRHLLSLPAPRITSPGALMP